MQIGPRIRVGGTLGKIGQNVKIGVGKLNSAAAPVASFFNPAIGAMLAASGRVLDTSNGGSSLGDIAMSAGKNYLGGRVGSAALGKIPGVGGILNAANKVPGVSAAGNFLSAHGVGDFLKSHGGDLLKAAQGVNAAYLGHKASGMANNALGSATSSYDQRAPLRVAGVQGMLAAQQRTPRSEQIASTNPYAPRPASDLLSKA